MNSSSLHRLLLIAGLALAGSRGLAADAAETAAAAKESQKAAAGASVDVQKLIEQFNSQRDTVLANRQKLVDQLKTATEEQRKAILEKMQNQQKDLLDAQRALGKQIRDDLRRQRESQVRSGH